MFQPRINVLFVSQRNSLRSLLAQTCLNHLGRERFLAHSCGSVVPLDGQPHPLVTPALRAAEMPAGLLASLPVQGVWAGDLRDLAYVG